MRGVYLGNNRVLVSLTWGGMLIVPADDLSISPLLIHSGHVEIGLTKYLLNHVRPGMKAIDAGAHVGYFATLLGHRVGAQGMVYAYEANPDMFAFLRDNINVNYLSTHVRPLNKAVFSSPGVAEFHVTERFHANSSIFPREESYLQNHADTIRKISVPTEPLDACIAEMGRVDIIKMDIEGAEYQAFRGMMNSLERGLIDTIIFEYAPTMLRDDHAPLCDLLYQLESEYEFFYPQEDGTLKAHPLEHLLGFVYLHSIIMKRRTE